MPTRITRQKLYKTRRGDTLIEVMFAFAIFSLVAIITLATMSVGLSTTENSLELTVARNELNAQAEALRFIHSSYVSELTLPPCESDTPITEKCQQYASLWEDLTKDAYVMSSSTSASMNALTIEYPLLDCATAYDPLHRITLPNIMLSSSILVNSSLATISLAAIFRIITPMP